MHTYITCALFQGLYSRTLYKMYKILELILIPALTLSALTLHAEPGKQVWQDLLRPTCCNVENIGQMTYFNFNFNLEKVRWHISLRGGKPWRQRSTEDHGAVGEWISPRIWIEVGTSPLAAKGERWKVPKIGTVQRLQEKMSDRFKETRSILPNCFSPHQSNWQKKAMDMFKKSNGSHDIAIRASFCKEERSS